MTKNKILLLGYSSISKKRYINTFLKQKIKFSVASKSYKKRIKGVSEQYSNYDEAITNSDANIVFISLPNSLHFHWAKKALINGYHVVVDKPLSNKVKETKKLINIAKKNKKLLSEAIFYNYHRQIKKVQSILKKSGKLDEVKVQFVIPMPSKKSLLMSANFLGGAIMDMGPYASSIHRIFFKKKIISKKLNIKLNSKKLPISFKIKVNYKNQCYNGLFKFGGEYKNEIAFFTKKKVLSLERLFSPPEELDLNINIINKDKVQNIKILRDNCFENYLLEVIKNINFKKYSFYFKQILQDHLFRDKIEKKFLKMI
tara:strand:- start:842 stop:1783 length:942 start_codon:yes stop_codon:yes gene_type:complete